MIKSTHNTNMKNKERIIINMNFAIECLQSANALASTVRMLFSDKCALADIVSAFRNIL